MDNEYSGTMLDDLIRSALIRSRRAVPMEHFFPHFTVEMFAMLGLLQEVNQRIGNGKFKAKATGIAVLMQESRSEKPHLAFALK